MSYLRVFLASSVALYGGLLFLFWPLSNDMKVTFHILSCLFGFDIIYFVLIYRNPRLSVWMKNNYWNVAMSTCALSALLGFIIGKSNIISIVQWIQNIAIGMGLDQPSVYHEYNKDVVVCTFTVAMMGGMLSCIFMKPNYKAPRINFEDNKISNNSTIMLVIFIYFIIITMFKIYYNNYYDNDDYLFYGRYIDSNLIKIIITSYLVSNALFMYQMAVFRACLIPNFGRRAFQD